MTRLVSGTASAFALDYLESLVAGTGRTRLLLLHRVEWAAPCFTEAGFLVRKRPAENGKIIPCSFLRGSVAREDDRGEIISIQDRLSQVPQTDT